MRPFIRNKALVPGTLAVAITFVGAVLGVGWYVSEIIEDKILVVRYLDPPLDLKVVAIGEDQVTLVKTSLTEADGNWKTDGI